ncbi:DUF2971 domain-containing protein [Pseudomonas sp. FW305-E2]|uniref:DUF2971 domain-containing protein n=1 Tax=Pseudomonas sp. FW305-E2 TaxID=2075558 RepID=UPI000B4EC80A|nr:MULTISPECIES: DUF2971 domain-containing protein [Pseudomonas]POA85071.1 DUF2971 domain-containing protein [Pseudomonas sp. FW305-E2]
MMVYHFCNEQYGLQNIEKSRLKVATVMDLNDPFEMMCLSSDDPKIREGLRFFKKRVADIYGMLCFSRTYASPVQWGHYGDRHRGLCLAFEIDEESLDFVEYLSERMIFDANEYLSKTKDQKSEFMRRQLRIKHLEWSYEKEVSKIFSLDKAETSGGLYFMPFAAIGKLCQVIVGCNSSLEKSKLSAVLESHHPEVEVFKVRTAFKGYEIVRNRNDNLWK